MAKKRITVDENIAEAIKDGKFTFMEKVHPDVMDILTQVFDAAKSMNEGEHVHLALFRITPKGTALSQAGGLSPEGLIGAVGFCLMELKTCLDAPSDTLH